MKNKLILNERVLELYEQKFKKDILINFFSVNNYVYFSQNFENTQQMYQFVGNISAMPVNSWEEEKKLTNVFLISDEDYKQACYGIFSKEVDFILSEIKRKQTKKDTEEGKITSDIYIVKESVFLEYYADRKAFIEKYKNQDYEFSKELLFQVMTKNALF